MYLCAHDSFVTEILPRADTQGGAEDDGESCEPRHREVERVTGRASAEGSPTDGQVQGFIAERLSGAGSSKSRTRGHHVGGDVNFPAGAVWHTRVPNTFELRRRYLELVRRSEAPRVHLTGPMIPTERADELKISWSGHRHVRRFPWLVKVRSRKHAVH